MSIFISRGKFKLFFQIKENLFFCQFLKIFKLVKFSQSNISGKGNL